MKKISKWLGSKLPWFTTRPEPGAVEEQEQAIPMPDIYADDDAITVPNLRILDEETPEAEMSIGFDPYDTARFSKEKK